jgi:hypothetical protein
MTVAIGDRNIALFNVEGTKRQFCT